MRRGHIVGGIYTLFLFVESGRWVSIGRLGKFYFPGGYYVYVGGALNGLKHRVQRHLSQKKRPHWHIDYLLAQARVMAVWTYPTGDRLECFLNHALAKAEEAEVIAPGFGSSDCGCPTHLWWMRTWTTQERALEQLEGVTGRWTYAVRDSGVAQCGQVHLIHGPDRDQGKGRDIPL